MAKITETDLLSGDEMRRETAGTLTGADRHVTILPPRTQGVFISDAGRGHESRQPREVKAHVHAKVWTPGFTAAL